MSALQGKQAVLITGPTAGGKSALALEIARARGGIIINADSMQVYDGLSVLTARPAATDLAAAPHRLYGHVPPGTAGSAASWLNDVRGVLASEPERLPVFVGGTGLYFRALLGGLSAMPDIPDEVRAHWRNRLAEDGAPTLHAVLALADPQTARILKEGDGQRIVRALEVFAASGRPISEWQKMQGTPLIDVETAHKIVVMPERAVLHERINRRFEQMIECGAMEEVRGLLALGLDPAMPVMKAIGVRELGAVLAGQLSISEASMRAKAQTRQYAKRQMTWIRNQLGADWQSYRR